MTYLFCCLGATGNSSGVAVFAFFEVALGLGVALGGGFAAPVAGQDIVGRDALAGEVELGKIVLCGGVALAGGEAVPVGGLGVVAGDALAAAVERAEFLLRVGPVLGGGL